MNLIVVQCFIYTYMAFVVMYQVCKELNLMAPNYFYKSSAVPKATEQRKHDAKYKELGWICVPMMVEAYGAWGTEAKESFSLLVSPLATSSNRAKAEVLAALYGRLNLNLVRANATAILSRCFVPDY